MNDTRTKFLNFYLNFFVSFNMESELSICCWQMLRKSTKCYFEVAFPNRNIAIHHEFGIYKRDEIEVGTDL